MEDILKLADKVSQRLAHLAESSAVIAKPVSVGGRHVVPLCELSLAFGSGGGIGEGEGPDPGAGKNEGKGGAAGGAAKATPVALLIIDEDGVRLQGLGA